MELGRLWFVVDENTLAVGKVMQQLRDDVAYVGDPRISDLIPRRSLDRHWIPVVAAHGWVAITNDHRALFRIGPVESVEFERGDRGEAEGELSQRSTIPDGQNLPVLEVGNAAFDGGADTREMLVRFNLCG